MGLAQDLPLQEGELFTGRQLPSTGVAGKAGQMENQISRPPDPIRGWYAAEALGAFRPKSSAMGEDRFNKFLVYYTDQLIIVMEWR